MAGAGYKLFNTGDVLTAQQVNEYLQQQTVMVFANSTARTTALSGVLAEGMMSYLQDTNVVEVYNGSAWTSVATGDITGVTAGVGISGGGTSGDVTITNSMATAIDAKGDLIAGTGADTFARLAVGTNGNVLKANSATATGLEWGSASSATNWSLLNTGGTSLTGNATVTVSGISNKSAILIAIDQASSASQGAIIGIRINGDANSNYLRYGFELDMPASYAAGNMSYSAGSDTMFPVFRMASNAASTGAGYVLINGANGTGFKVLTGAGSATASTSNTNKGYSIGGFWNSTSSITSVSAFSNSGSFDAGTLWVYGTD